MYDVAIIGCGVVGASAAYLLSKYNLSVAVLEKENDVANQTTKANSAIIHAGYDPEPGTLMAKLNVKGSQMMEALAQSLSVDYKKIGSLVLGFTPQDSKTLQALYRKGVQNGVQGLRLVSGEQARELEPNLSPEVTEALFAPSAAIICPWDLCIAQAEVAAKNGVEIRLNHTVINIEKTEDGYEISTNQGKLYARYMINAAGVYADKISNMVAEQEFQTIPNRGQYYMLDKNQGWLVGKVIFQCPSKEGKGVLVAPTVHGNAIAGPTAEDILCGEDVATTSEGLEKIRALAAKSVPSINFRESIRNFAGVRAITQIDDFIIAQAKGAKGFVNLAGIKSPGLSSAPAIAEMGIELLQSAGLVLESKLRWDGTRPIICFKELSVQEKHALIQKDPRYGRVICRCETITEGEIVAALHSYVPPRTVDGVKRRCGAGMGRCQGGFCGPRVQEIIARELGIPMQEVLQDKAGTVIITGTTKCGGGVHA